MSTTAYSLFHFKDGTPAPPAGYRNVKWQKSAPYTDNVTLDGTIVQVSAIDISSYVPNIGGRNAQTGASFSISAGQRGQITTSNNAGAVAVGLDSTVSNDYFAFFENVGAGTATLTPTSGTIDGAANLAVAQNQGVVLFFDGTNWTTERGMGSGGGGGGGLNGVNAQTTNYTALSGDNGKLISFSSTSAVQLLLPAAPPSSTWSIFVENTNTGVLTVNPNGLTIDGSSSNILCVKDEGFFISTDGTNYFTSRGRPPIGAVNSQTTNYTAASNDYGKLISFNSASAVTLTLPAAPPSPRWFIFIENVGAGLLTVNRNGLNIDGAATNIFLSQNQGCLIFTDNSNYFSNRGIDGLNGVNAQSGTSYTAVASDNAKLISFTNGSAMTLTLPATSPFPQWSIFVQNRGAGSLTISRNGNQIDGAASDVTVPAGCGVEVLTDGTNYFTQRGLGLTGVYDFCCFVNGKPLAAMLVLAFKAVRAFTLPANFAGSTGRLTANPTATATYTMKKNGSTIGTVSISTGGVFTFATTGGTSQSVAVGDDITLLANSSQDATLVDVGLFFTATR